jgi:dTDP-glucose pyrophosphorylase
MINVLQLCAGKGSRFANTHAAPKPFIDINNKPMFIESLDSLSVTSDVRVHHLFQKSHIEQYNPSQYTSNLIHSIDHYTDGAATSAYSVIANSDYKNESWLIIDCDFMIQHDFANFLANSQTNLIFAQEFQWDKKSSYCCVDENLNVFGVAEKQPISKYRNTGQYYWASGELFVDAYEFYKQNELLSNGEFYIAPLFNHTIQNGNNVKLHLVEDFKSIGTPDDLKRYMMDTNYE